MFTSRIPSPEERFVRGRDGIIYSINARHPRGWLIVSVSDHLQYLAEIAFSVPCREFPSDPFARAQYKCAIDYYKRSMNDFDASEEERVKVATLIMGDLMECASQLLQLYGRDIDGYARWNRSSEECERAHGEDRYPAMILNFVLDGLGKNICTRKQAMFTPFRFIPHPH